jgi:hypothetical protein
MLVDSAEADVHDWYGPGAAPAFAPLVEWMRPFAPAGGDVFEWPLNLAGGESPCSGYAAQLFASEGWRVAAVNVGQSARSVDYLEEGGLGTAFAGMVYELTTMEALADAAGSDLVVDAVLLVHGEADANRADIAAKWRELREDSEAAIRAVTGQPAGIPMVLSAPCCTPTGSAGPGTSILACWQLAEAEPRLFVVAPKHHYAYSADNLHLDGWGSLRLGEHLARVALRHRAGLPAQLRPVSAALSAPDAIRVEFEVPVPPLQWSTTLPATHPGTPEWAEGRGFELWTGSSTKVEVLSAEIDGSAVVLTLAAPLVSAATVGAALWTDVSAVGALAAGTAAGRHCPLCDSDAWVSQSARAVACDVAEGGAEVVCAAAGALAFVGARMLAEGAGLAGAHVVSVDGDAATLSAPWTGDAGEAEVTFRNDHRNYVVQFALPVEPAG